MGELDRPQPSRTIVYKNYFVLKSFYEWFHDFLMDQGYKAAFLSPSGDEQLERYYAQTSTTNNVWIYDIIWKLKKPVNAYIFKELEISMLGLPISNIEVMVNNKKVKAQKGEFRVILKPVLKVNFDSKDKGINAWIVKKFKPLLKGYYYKHELDKYENEFVRELNEITNYLSRFFALPLTTQYSIIHPERGLE